MYCILLSDVAAPAASTSVLLVTELIRLTLKKLQVALEDNRINDDDLVAMAMAVDAGAVSAAVKATRGATAQTPDFASSTVNTSEIPSSFTDRPTTMVYDKQNQPNMVSPSEIVAVAKKVICEAIDNLSEQ